MNPDRSPLFRLATLVGAMLPVFGWTPAAAQEGDIAEFAAPVSSISVGAGIVDGVNKRFGQYNGMAKEGAYGLLDFEVLRRDNATGTWLNVYGRNLGFESRELGFAHSRQGNWGYFLDFSQTPRYSQYDLTTRLTGFDTTFQRIGGEATAQRVELKTERKTLNFGFDKELGGGFDVKVRFRNEEKEGRRLFGRSGGAAGADFLIDPIDYSTQMMEATAAYAGEKLQLSGGFYGTNFVNRKAKIDVLGGAGVAFTPIALPPGNQSQQLHLSGGYSFTPATRATFKLAHTRATQEDAFMDVTTTNRTNLGGQVQTTLVQFGLTARPLPKLSLLANFRYDNRKDTTPVVDYFNIATTTTATGENEPRSIRTIVGKLEATYLLPLGLRLTGGAEYDERKRNSSSVRVVSYRETTEEKAYRLELRRSIGETVTGSFGFIGSRRTGSDFETTRLTTGAVGSNLIAPYHLADRDRDKWRARLGWMPLEQLDLHFTFDDSKDDYSGRVLGPRKGKAQTYSADAAYSFGESWQASAWVSRDTSRMEQVSCQSASSAGVCPNSIASPIWGANLENTGTAWGFGLRGKPMAKLEVGADLQYAQDRGSIQQSALTPGATASQIPDSTYRRATLKLYGSYAVQKNAGVRLSYIRESFSIDDWTWNSNFVFSDGTRILQAPRQTVDFIGISGYYEFR